jgi:hypothetical protein
MCTILRIVVLLCVATSTGAAAATATVFPTGSYPVDVQNVQAALDQGGVVLLKATNAAGFPMAFNFGPSGTDGGWVEFHRDAELVGEQVPGGRTTIEGGWYPVESFGEASNVAVRNITFKSSFDGALLLLYGSNTEVTGNRASHVIGSFRVPTRTIAEVFVVGFSSRVLIEHNFIETTVADLAIGVSQFGASGAVSIRENTISDTGYGAIESSFNARFGEPATVNITDNVLRPGLAPGAFGMGIEVNGEGSYYIARNDITIESTQGLGIYALGAPRFGIAPMIAPVIEKNRVTVQPAPDTRPVFADGIDLVGVVSRAYVGQNSIDGTAFSALGLYDAGVGSDLGFNTYVGNQIATFRALVADVFLDTATHDTVIKGESGVVIDLGTNNSVTGASAIAKTGDQVHEAMRHRHEAVQAASEGLLRRGATY